MSKLRPVPASGDDTSPNTLDLTLAVLSDWGSSCTWFTEQQAEAAGFSMGPLNDGAQGGQGSGGAQGGQKPYLLVIDVVRSRQVKIDDKPVHKLGYGYRLLVVVNERLPALANSLEAMAAAAELGLIRGTISLEVKGYKGSEIWPNLPSPAPLTKSTYQEFVNAGQEIRKIFAKNADECVQVKLAEEVKAEPDDESKSPEPEGPIRRPRTKAPGGNSKPSSAPSEPRRNSARKQGGRRMA